MELLVFTNKDIIHATKVRLVIPPLLIVTVDPSILKSVKLSDRQDKLFFASQKVGCGMHLQALENE